MRFNRLVSTLLVTGSVGLGMLAMGAGAARADIIVSLESITGSGPYTWTYGALLHSNQRIENGDFFTIHDFFGFTGVHSEPLGWTFSSPLISPDPPFVDRPDANNVVNLLWTRTGGTINTPVAGVDVDLGDFLAESTVNIPTTGHFASMGTKDEGNLSGTPVGNGGLVEVPMVPEPGTMALLGLGVAPLLRRLRRRSGE